MLERALKEILKVLSSKESLGVLWGLQERPQKGIQD